MLFTLYTDGACAGNGRAGARASFAMVVPVAGRAAVVRGPVQPRAYALDGLTLRADGPALAPSNNRGELLGIVHALLAVLSTLGACDGDVPFGGAEIVSDSLLCIRTLDEWLPARRARGTAHELKNMDLVGIAEALLARARAKLPVRLTHVRSHRAAPARGSPGHAAWAGNDLADRQAALAGDEVETLDIEFVI